MEPEFILAGKLNREYILPLSGRPMLDIPGGHPLYAAGGLAVWEKGAGLLARVGEDFPHEWLGLFEQRGLDTRGVRIIPGALDLRSFIAYNDSLEPMRKNPMAHFVRLGMTFPKSLLGYQPPIEQQERFTQPDPAAPHVSEIPSEYLNANCVHICPLDYLSQSQLLAAFQRESVTTISLDPSPGYMNRAFLDKVRSLLGGLTVFSPSEEELRSLFWGKTNDLWEMAEVLGKSGCEMVVVKCGGQGQLLYDAMSKRRWEIPAYPARVADPTGIGDAFCGGFLAGYRKTYDPLQAVMYGNVSASLCIEGSGPFYSFEVLPGLAQARMQSLKEFVRRV